MPNYQTVDARIKHAYDVNFQYRYRYRVSVSIDLWYRVSGIVAIDGIVLNLVNCEVECEVFMRGGCKLQGRKVRGMTMTARGGRRRDALFIA